MRLMQAAGSSGSAGGDAWATFNRVSEKETILGTTQERCTQRIRIYGICKIVGKKRKLL